MGVRSTARWRGRFGGSGTCLPARLNFWLELRQLLLPYGGLVKKLRYTTLVCIVLPLGALVGVSPALAASDKCHAISAKGLGSATGPTTTTARITGGGFLNGTTSG